jgi:hypothetical protein
MTRESHPTARESHPSPRVSHPSPRVSHTSPRVSHTTSRESHTSPRESHSTARESPTLDTRVGHPGAPNHPRVALWESVSRGLSVARCAAQTHAAHDAAAGAPSPR